MGYALAACEGGCTCMPGQWDTLHSAKVRGGGRQVLWGRRRLGAAPLSCGFVARPCRAGLAVVLALARGGRPSRPGLRHCGARRARQRTRGSAAAPHAAPLHPVAVPPPPPWLDHQPEPLRLGGPQAQGHRADAGRGRDRRGAGGGARRLAGGRAGARCCCCGGGAGCLLGVVVMVVLTRCHRLCRPAVWDGQRGRRRGSATRLMCGRQAPPARLQPSLRLPPRCVVVLDLAC